MADSMQKVVIGKRQILRELKNNNVAHIIIAADAETQYIHSLIDAAVQSGVKYAISGTMQEIAAQYGIEVPCGAVGVLL